MRWPCRITNRGTDWEASYYVVNAAAWLYSVHARLRCGGADLWLGHDQGAWTARIPAEPGNTPPGASSIGSERVSAVHELSRRGGRRRRVYRITAAGRRALAAAKIKVRELFGELFASI